MKLLVMGLDAADPERLLGDERLANMRRLMEFGCYGRLEGLDCLPGELAWICMAAGQVVHSSNESLSTLRPTIWEHLANQGKRAILLGLSAAFPEPVVICTPVERLNVEYPVQWVEVAPLAESQRLRAIQTQSRARFASIRRVLLNQQWDYLQFVDPGPAHLRQSLPDEAYPEAAAGYYLHLDQELGTLLELLPEAPAILVVSPRGDLATQGAPGSFILAAANNPLAGEIRGASLIDMAPTLLEIGGYDIPSAMQGRPLLAGITASLVSDTGLPADEEELLRERLSGLGYL
jgi:hypothetical protein